MGGGGGGGGGKSVSGQNLHWTANWESADQRNAIGVCQVVVTNVF